MEREDGDVGLCARAVSAVVGADGVGRVVDDGDAPHAFHDGRRGLEHRLDVRFVDQRHDGVVVAGPARNVDGQDDLGARCDGASDGIDRDVEVVAAVHHHGFCTCPQHGQCRRAVGVGGDDDLVVRFHAQPAQRHDGACGPRVDAEHLASARELLDFLFQRLHFRSGRYPSRAQRVGHFGNDAFVDIWWRKGYFHVCFPIKSANKSAYLVQSYEKNLRMTN